MEEEQNKIYRREQDQIKQMKDYVARFGHGTAKNAKQAQSKEKVLDKMIKGGLTEKVYNLYIYTLNLYIMYTICML